MLSSEKEWGFEDDEITPSGTSNGNPLDTDGNGIGGYGEGAADAAFGMLMPASPDFTDGYANPVAEGQNSPSSPTPSETKVVLGDNGDSDSV